MRGEPELPPIVSAVEMKSSGALRSSADFFSNQRGDDSFIFYRVADNVLAGHGPVFNRDERVEAATKVFTSEAP